MRKGCHRKRKKNPANDYGRHPCVGDPKHNEEPTEEQPAIHEQSLVGWKVSCTIGTLIEGMFTSYLQVDDVPREREGERNENQGCHGQGRCPQKTPIRSQSPHSGQNVWTSEISSYSRSFQSSWFRSLERVRILYYRHMGLFVQ